MAATWLLPEAVGMPVARELLFTGRRVDADEALRIGLVNGVFEPDALLDGALDVACRIAGNGPVAVRLTVAGLRSGGHRSLEAALAVRGAGPAGHVRDQRPGRGHRGLQGASNAEVHRQVAFDLEGTVGSGTAVSG